MALFGRNKNADKSRDGKDDKAPEKREEGLPVPEAPEMKAEAGEEKAERPEAAPAGEAAPAAPAAPAGADPGAAYTPVIPLRPAGTPNGMPNGTPNGMPNGTQEPPKTETPRPRFHTPEGFDFNRYFLAERRIMLENVSYETGRIPPGQSTYRLNVRDTIVAQVLGQAGVKVTYNRTLSFEPEGPFTLSVSFSVMLVFNPGTRGEIDWKTIDVAEEFKKNCPQLTQTMMVKATLLIGEITAANGSPILPMPPRS